MIGCWQQQREPGDIPPLPYIYPDLNSKSDAIIRITSVNHYSMTKKLQSKLYTTHPHPESPKLGINKLTSSTYPKTRSPRRSGGSTAKKVRRSPRRTERSALPARRRSFKILPFLEACSSQLKALRSPLSTLNFKLSTAFPHRPTQTPTHSFIARALPSNARVLGNHACHPGRAITS